MPPASRGLFAALEQLSDPRGRQGQRHPFTAMLAAVVCATLCGARGFKPVAQWLRAQEPATWHWLGFKRTPPCANCFADLLKLIDPEDLERVIRGWVDQLDCVQVEDDSLHAVSIDGKTLCGTSRWQNIASPIMTFPCKTSVFSKLKAVFASFVSGATWVWLSTYPV